MSSSASNPGVQHPDFLDERDVVTGACHLVAAAADRVHPGELAGGAAEALGQAGFALFSLVAWRGRVARVVNWALYVFYGGDIREAELPWLRAQVERMAALPPADDDGDMPAGLFVISDERAAVSVWEVRDGTVQDRPASELSWVLRGMAHGADLRV